MRGLLENSDIIEAVEVVTPAPGAVHHVARVPDGTTALLFRSHVSGACDLTVLGPLTRARHKAVDGLRFSVRLRLRAGCSVVSLEPEALVDQVVPWGEALLEELRGQSPRDVARRLAFLATRHSRPAPRLIARAQQLLSGTDVGEEGPLVASTAQQLGVSERHLRRVFQRSVGVSPKRYARMARVRRALAHLERDASAGWAQIAAGAGFFDQAHLTAEFREFLGVTPAGFRREGFRASRAHALTACQSQR